MVVEYTAKNKTKNKNGKKGRNDAVCGEKKREGFSYPSGKGKKCGDM